MTEINLNVFRAAGHRLVDRIVDEFEELIREGMPEVVAPAAGAASSDDPPSRKVRRAPLAVTDRRPLTTVSMSVATTRGGYQKVAVRIPLAIASRANLAAGRSASIEFTATTLVIEEVREGWFSVVRQSESTVKINLGGTKLGLTEPHPATPCTCSLIDHLLVIDLPAWWPTPGHVSRRARAAAPEAPPVPVKIEDAPSRKAAIAHRPAPPAAPPVDNRALASPQGVSAGAVDGGWLIPLADRECFCHTCQTQVATISCDTCNALFCAGCWSSHLLTHRKPSHGSRPPAVIHA